MKKLLLSSFTVLFASSSFALTKKQQIVCNYLDINSRSVATLTAEFSKADTHRNQAGREETIWVAELEGKSPDGRYTLIAEGFAPEDGSELPYLIYVSIRDSKTGFVAQAEHGFGKKNTDSLQARFIADEDHVTLECLAK